MQDIELQSLEPEAKNDAPAAAPAPKKRKAAPKKAAKPRPKPVKKTEPVEKKTIAEPAPKLTKSVVFTQERPKKASSKSIKSAGIVGAGILLLAAAAFAVLQSQQSGQEAKMAAENVKSEIGGEVDGLKQRLQALTEELQKQQKEQEEVKMSNYTSGKLGLVFQYPSELGSVEETATDPDPEKANDEYYTLTFSANPDIWFIASAKGYKGDRPFVYDGATADLKTRCSKPLEVTDDGYCDVLTVAGQETVSEVKPLGEETLLNVVRSVPLNLTSSPYNGMTVNVGLGLPPVTGRNLFAPTDENKQQDALASFYRNLIKGSGLSLVVKDNIAAYEAILGTMRSQPAAGPSGS